jgi:hypothetical protein
MGFPKKSWRVLKPQEMASESASLESASDYVKWMANSTFLRLQMA